MSAGTKAWKLRYEAQIKKCGAMRNAGSGSFDFGGGLLAHDLKDGANKRKQQRDGPDVVRNGNAEPGRDNFPDRSEEEFHAVNRERIHSEKLIIRL